VFNSRQNLGSIATLELAVLVDWNILMRGIMDRMKRLLVMLLLRLA